MNFIHYSAFIFYFLQTVSYIIMCSIGFPTRTHSILMIVGSCVMAAVVWLIPTKKTVVK
jgi:hypothetical protein